MSLMRYLMCTLEPLELPDFNMTIMVRAQGIVKVGNNVVLTLSVSSGEYETMTFIEESFGGYNISQYRGTLSNNTTKYVIPTGSESGIGAGNYIVNIRILFTDKYGQESIATTTTRVTIKTVSSPISI